MNLKYNLKLKISQLIAIIAILLLAFPCLATSFTEIDIAKHVSTLPSQVLLALIALGCLAFAYRTWSQLMVQQERHLKAMEAITKKMDNSPCLMTHEKIQGKYCYK